MKYKYESLSTQDDLNNKNHTQKPHRELIHHRSLLMGVFIGLSFTIIIIFILLPSLSIYYYDTTSVDTNSQSATTDIVINLFDNVRILCMVFTHEKSFRKKAYVVKRTWGRRCNKLLFMSNTSDPNKLIDVTVLDVSESRETLWKKTKLSFKHAYDHFLNDFDWFLKADDDTYVIMENLRHYLYPYPSDVPLIFGFQFHSFYMSGGAGYILSREAVKLFIEKVVHNKEKCHQGDGGAEDAEMGHCLHNVLNITFGDARDEFGKERFFPANIGYLLNERHPDLKFWYYKDGEFYHNETGFACCSNTAITFHYMSNIDILSTDYLLYHLKKQKMGVALKDLPPKLSKKGF